MAVIMNAEQIKEILPQREPMLLLDEVSGLMPGSEVLCARTILANEVWLQGHYPGYPVVPSFLLLEMLTQAAELCLLSQPENKGKALVLMEAGKVRFTGKLLPGDRADVELKVQRIKGEIVSARGSVAKEGDKILIADLVLSFSSSPLGQPEV